MVRDERHQFVSGDTATLLADAVRYFEGLTGETLARASPERLFLQWAMSIIGQERMVANYIGNQNVPRSAMGENLDALGEMFYASRRPEAQAAICRLGFTLSAPQKRDIYIPKGTRATDSNGLLFWATEEEGLIPAGETYGEVGAVCQTVGLCGNGYLEGQITVPVDIFPFCAGVTNTTISDGGADRATDDEYYQLMRLSQDAHSTAGSRGSYIYHTKKVSTAIGDVAVNAPRPGEVAIYFLMVDGSLPSETLKAEVLEACSGDTVRPLTDLVSVEDPEVAEFGVDVTYFMPTDSGKSAGEWEALAAKAVDDFVIWQCGKLGRDLNPSYLVGLLMKQGFKRVEVREPVHRVLSAGVDNAAPQIAQLTTAVVTNGGYEDD